LDFPLSVGDEGIALVAALRGCGACAKDRELDIIAAVQWQTLNRSLLNHLADGCGFGLEGRPLGLDYDLSRRLANSEVEVNGKAVLKAEIDSGAGNALEPRGGSGNPIIPRPKIDDGVQAVMIGGGGGNITVGSICNGDCGIGDDRARRIVDSAGNSAGINLGVQRQRRERCKESKKSNKRAHGLPEVQHPRGCRR